jgi:hypothetical protein
MNCKEMCSIQNAKRRGGGVRADEVGGDVWGEGGSKKRIAQEVTRKRVAEKNGISKETRSKDWKAKKNR